MPAGLRYTQDKTEASIKDARVWVGFPYAGTGVAPGLPTLPASVPFDPTSPPVPPRIEKCVYGDPDPAVNGCRDELEQTSEAVTGLFDVDYFLTQDIMLYAKYARGYRMGSINMFGGDPFRTFDPERVDAYEIGAKTTFGGVVPGTFNAALFYNDLSDQQLQVGYVPRNGTTPTTGISNAGSSVIQGFELETSLMLLDDLMLAISYTYLDTELKETEALPNIPNVVLIPSSVAHEHLTYSPRHSVVASLNYRLPLPVEIGDVSLGATYAYTDKQLASAPPYNDPFAGLSGSPYAWMPSYEVVNFNANWNGIFGSNFDVGVFITNAFDEKYETYVAGLYNSTGFETRNVGVPKMWGAKVRYTFGR